MILAFAHPALVVPDLSRAVAFYRDMFGFQVIGEEGWAKDPLIDRAVGCRGSAAKGVMMAGHNCFLELFEFSAPATTGPAPELLNANEPGIRHLAFYVDDCRAEYRRLIALGGQTLGEPAADVAGHWAVYGRDPFGNIIELAEIPNEREMPTGLPGVSALGGYEGRTPNES